MNPGFYSEQEQGPLGSDDQRRIAKRGKTLN